VLLQTSTAATTRPTFSEFSGVIPGEAINGAKALNWFTRYQGKYGSTSCCIRQKQKQQKRA